MKRIGTKVNLLFKNIFIRAGMDFMTSWVPVRRSSLLNISNCFKHGFLVFGPIGNFGKLQQINGE
jgi:hypothetical protein